MRAFLLLLPWFFSTTEVSASNIELSSNCPPTFEKLDDGTCQLRTLYDFYDSPPQHGGVRAELPKLKHRYTPEQIDLGRYLFFDPILSVNQDMSCASCHQLDKSFTDGRKRSLGVVVAGERKELHRSTPSLWNVAFLKQFMWDGRSDDLETQAELPLLAADEMGNTREGVTSAVHQSAVYRTLFKAAFDHRPTFENINIALAAFQSSLVSLNSRYDRYAHGDNAALSPKEIRGYNAFRGFVARCSQCHVPPLFTDSEMAVIGAPENDQQYADPGAGELSDDPFLMGAFRVPTLRNITKTAPYFHSGQFENLHDTVRFYNNTRGHVAPESQDLKIHWHIHMTKGPKLNERNIDDIVAFLHTLEDERNLPESPQYLPSGLRHIPALTGPEMVIRKKGP